MAHIVMAHIVMAYIGKTYIVMASGHICGIRTQAHMDMRAGDIRIDASTGMSTVIRTGTYILEWKEG